jgi:hypothetical protein
MLMSVLFKSIFANPQIDPSKLVIVEVTPLYVDRETSESFEVYAKFKQLTTKQKKNKDLLTFAKSKKIDRKYVFDIEGWKYVVKKVCVINQKTIRYEILYTPLSTCQPSTTCRLSIMNLNNHFADGFWKSTSSGDLIPLSNKKDDTFVQIAYKELKVFQK